jgi:hypothetical protein
LEVKRRGKIFAYLTAVYAHAHSTDSYIRIRIEEAIKELFKDLNLKDLNLDTYKELIDGYIEAKVPLQLLIYTSKFLPFQPTLGEVPGKEKEGFYVERGQEIRTIIGTNESGKNLVKCMIEAVRERSRRKELESQKPENLKNKKER